VRVFLNWVDTGYGEKKPKRKAKAKAKPASKPKPKTRPASKPKPATRPASKPRPAARPASRPKARPASKPKPAAKPASKPKPKTAAWGPFVATKVTGRAGQTGWVKATFDVWCGARSETVSGEVLLPLGVLGVNKNVGASGYGLTHLPSGLRGCSGKTASAMKAAGERMQAVKTKGFPGMDSKKFTEACTGIRAGQTGVLPDWYTTWGKVAVKTCLPEDTR